MARTLMHTKERIVASAMVSSRGALGYRPGDEHLECFDKPNFALSNEGPA